MRRLFGVIAAMALAIVLVGGVGAAARGELWQPSERDRAADAAADPPAAVLSRQQMLDALVSSGTASKDTALAPCPSDLRIDHAPDGSLVRTSGLGVYHREHPEVWILADGTCAIDPHAVGTKRAPASLP